jgi:heptosyltransferase II
VSALVIQTSFLGDVVLTTPLLASLAARGAVDVLVTPQAAPLLAGHPAVRTVLVYDKRGRNRGVVGFARQASTLRQNSYDVAYLAQGSHRSGALALAAGIPTRVGFDTSAGSRWYTHRVPYRRTAHHAARLLALAGESPGSNPRPSLSLTLAATAQAAQLLSTLPGRDKRPLVALAPGSVWATKRWAHFPALAAAIAPHARLVLIGGPDDRAAAQEIREAAGPHAALIDSIGIASLPVSAALIASSSAIVSNDSLPLHLASAMGTPTVAIFGPTVPAMGFGPLAPRAVIVQHHSLECRPCHAHGPMRCPLEHFRCMRDLPVAQVLDGLSTVGVAIPPP